MVDFAMSIVAGFVQRVGMVYSSLSRIWAPSRVTQLLTIAREK